MLFCKMSTFCLMGSSSFKELTFKPIAASVARGEKRFAFDPLTDFFTVFLQ